MDAEILRFEANEVMTEGFPKINANLDYNWNFQQQVNVIPENSFSRARQAVKLYSLSLMQQQPKPSLINLFLMPVISMVYKRESQFLIWQTPERI